MKRLRNFLFLTFGFYFLLLPFSFSVEGETPQAINDTHVVFFILDGTPKDFLYNLIEEGDLPTLKEYFWDNGAHVNAAITTFPSASAPAYQSFITGLFAGRGGIPYIEWYDRENQVEIDYLGLGYLRVNEDMRNLYSIRNPEIKDYDYPVTIFEKLNGYPASAVYSEISRGAKDRDPKIPVAAFSDAFLTGRQDRLDMLAVNDVMRLFKREKESEIPRFTLVGLYSSDVLQHKQGAWSEDAKYAIVQFDIFLKEFIDLLKKRSLFEKTYIVVVSDHGMHNIDHDVDLGPVFEKVGLKVKKTELKKEKADVFIGERGVASAHLYFFNGVKKENIDLLRNLETLSLVIAKNGYNYVDVYSKDCHSTIIRSTFDGRTYYGYRPNDCDPLSYCDDKNIKPMCNGKLFDDSMWLNKTWNKRYPDGVVQLGQIFDDGRAGDVFVVADDKGGFYKCKSATHGSLIREDMQVPILIHGPKVPVGEFGPIRTVDMYAAILSWFGLPKDENQDGCITKELKHCNNGATKAPEANIEAFMIGKPSLINSPNRDTLHKEFLKAIKGERRQNTNMLMLAELKRRNALLKKLNETPVPDTKRDLFSPLINDQINKTKASLLRLGDVRVLLDDKHWKEYRWPGR